jgi:hypothetical protein
MLTCADKAARRHTLVARGWSQRRIAKTFGMSQPGVSQLMATYPATGDEQQVIITTGEDGKTYTRVPTAPRGKSRRRPWEMEGKSFKAIVAALTAYPANL